jgi:DNA-binding IclR family transcriptional regulator
MRRRRTALTPAPSEAVNSLQRGLDILRCFQPAEDLLPATEIAQRLGLPRATARHLLDTLVEQDFLMRADDGERYGLHVACFAIGQAVLSGSALVRAARAPLQALADRHSVHALLAVGDRHDLLVLAHLTGVAAPAWTLGAGAHMPIADTAAGLAWLWAQAPQVQARWLSELRASSNPGALASLWRAFHELETGGLCATLWTQRSDMELLAAPLTLREGPTAVVACARATSAASNRPGKALESAMREALLTIREAVSQGHAGHSPSTARG